LFGLACRNVVLDLDVVLGRIIRMTVRTVDTVFTVSTAKEVPTGFSLVLHRQTSQIDKIDVAGEEGAVIERRV
jgi:hypothetical protein